MIAWKMDNAESPEVLKGGVFYQVSGVRPGLCGEVTKQGKRTSKTMMMEKIFRLVGYSGSGRFRIPTAVFY